MSLRNQDFSFPRVEGVILCTSTTHPANPYVGMRIYETDTGMDLIFSGPTVGFTMNWGMPWGLMAAPVSTGSNSTSFGTTETRDAVLGNYQFVSVPNRRYRVIFANAAVTAATAGDVIRANVRDSGSASTPTTSSTVLATGQIWCPTTGGGGQQTFGAIVSPFSTTTAATHTLAVFGQIAVGGPTTDLMFSINAARSIYVEDIGPSGPPT